MPQDGHGWARYMPCTRMDLPTDAATVNAWLRSLLKSTREFALVLLSADGGIAAWLGASELMFGYTEDEAVGMPFAALFTEEDVARGLDKQERDLALSGGRSEDDRWHVRKDGTRFWGSGVLEAVRDDAGNIVALAKTVRDRTDVRVQVETLQNRLTEAERINAARLRFLTSVAHEVRNQVNPVSNMLALLAREPNRPGGEKMLATMHDKVVVIARLMDDLAQASKGEVLRPQVAFRPVALHDAVRAAADFMRPEVERRHQSLRVTLPDVAISIDADPVRLDQMLVNLLGNACKFTHDGGEIQLSATVEVDMAAIRVEDNGAGIEPDVLPRIFELFTRESRDGAPDGLGVGLAVVKQLAMLHSGFIDGRSPGRGNGSVFTLRLPLRQPPPAPEPI
jgi:PAS domain S-box-containing protein